MDGKVTCEVPKSLEIKSSYVELHVISLEIKSFCEEMRGSQETTSRLGREAVDKVLLRRLKQLPKFWEHDFGSDLADVNSQTEYNYWEVRFHLKTRSLIH